MADQSNARLTLTAGALERFAGRLEESAGSLGSMSPWDRLAQIRAPGLKLTDLAAAHADRMRAAHTGIAQAMGATARSTRQDHNAYHETDHDAGTGIAATTGRIGGISV
ncbi:MAG: hypothetical protein ACRC20_13965 [Segniliparus sp.]|uniref:hypothetical protein n=1 Tax=Segniliparus sp. TaxID=2804064 RepID=UPI003F385F45